MTHLNGGVSPVLVGARLPRDGARRATFTFVAEAEAARARLFDDFDAWHGRLLRRVRVRLQ